MSYGGRPPAASARRDVESRSAPSKPVATFEPDVEPNADRSDDAEDDEISPLRLQFGHILEIHAVDSGNRGRHREDRSPGGKLTGDRTLALLFEQVTRLEHRDQDVADAGDGALNPEHVIVELRNLVAVVGTFHGKRVKAVIPGDVGKFCFAGLGHFDPHEVILADVLARRIDQGRRP